MRPVDTGDRAGTPGTLASVDAMVAEAQRRWASRGMAGEVGMLNVQHVNDANAYVSVGSNAGLIVGNAVGGVLVAAFGSGIAIAIDAMTFFVAGLLVFSFRSVSKPHDSGESIAGDLAHGWRVFISFRWVVVIVAAFSVIVMVERGAIEVMGPVLAREEYGGAAGWAVALAGMSVGLLVGGGIATRGRVGVSLRGGGGVSLLEV